MPGNHDVDLHFESVFFALREAAGGASEPSLSFVREGTLNESRIFIEHGNQYSYDNWFEFWDAPIRAAKNGEPRIERPWGTLFMDIVYNDIEDAYPFVNKIYPHDKLAGLVLRLMRDDTRVAVRALSRLVAFFASRGKRALAGWALGKEDEGDEDAVTTGSIAAFVDTFGEGMSEARRARSSRRRSSFWARRRAKRRARRPRSRPRRNGLLGHTDERGLDKRARDLLRSGKIDVVAFGHTHEPFEKNVALPGRIGKIVNTGSWIPRVEVTGEKAPSLAELARMPMKHELRCLWIELGGAPRGRARFAEGPRLIGRRHPDRAGAELDELRLREGLARTSRAASRP